MIPSGATGVTVTRPDGTTLDLVASAAGGASVSYVATDLPGIYTVTPIRPADASPNPSASGGRSPDPTPLSSARPSGSAAAPVVPVDPNAPVRFAVDLFDVGESNIAPGSVAAIEGLGAAPDPSGSPGNGAPTDRPTTRDELWLPIVLLVLLGLCVEWALYHRDAVVRIRRSLVARFGRQPGGTT